MLCSKFELIPIEIGFFANFKSCSKSNCTCTCEYATLYMYMYNANCQLMKHAL